MPLCSTHYQIVYRMKNVRDIEDSTYKICGTHCKHEKGPVCKLMYCPDPQHVLSYLRNVTGCDVCSQESDLVYSMCYNYFNQILKCGVCQARRKQLCIGPAGFKACEARQLWGSGGMPPQVFF